LESLEFNVNKHNCVAYLKAKYTFVHTTWVFNPTVGLLLEVTQWF